MGWIGHVWRAGHIRFREWAGVRYNCWRNVNRLFLLVCSPFKLCWKYWIRPINTGHRFLCCCLVVVVPFTAKGAVADRYGCTGNDESEKRRMRLVLVMRQTLREHRYQTSVPCDRQAQVLSKQRVGGLLLVMDHDSCNVLI